MLLRDYAAPGELTDTGDFGAGLAAVPCDLGSMVLAVQGLLVHEGWLAAHGLSPSAERSDEKQLCGTQAILERAAQLDGRPLFEPRPPDRRVVGVCRHFAILLVALARMRGIPSRARCGFATYFDPTKRVDHWVAEVWSEPLARWMLVDAQLDPLQQAVLPLDFDPLDVPRDRFLVAGEAWRLCAEGADPMRFGVAGTTSWGLLEVYGDLFQDLAALQKIELLPWAWYGLATDARGLDEVELIDRLRKRH